MFESIIVHQFLSADLFWFKELSKLKIYTCDQKYMATDKLLKVIKST